MLFCFKSLKTTWIADKAEQRQYQWLESMFITYKE